MECNIKTNNPIFTFFKENTNFAISRSLDNYLEDQLNKDIYDVLLVTRGLFESNVAGRSLLNPERGPCSDSMFFDDAYKICAECWCRPDPHNAIPPPYFHPDATHKDYERNYYSDIVAGITYVILSAQSALPDVAKSLITYIEYRQHNDILFFSHFLELSSNYINNNIAYDINFALFIHSNSNVKITHLYFKDYFLPRNQDVIKSFIYRDINKQPSACKTNNDNDSQEKRTQKVTTDVMLKILKMANISPLSDDKTKIARLISYLTNFSVESIRQRMSNYEELTSYHKDEVENINKILSDLNIAITIDYNKSR